METSFLVQRQQVDKEILNTLLDLTENPLDGIYLYPLNKGVVQALQQFGPAVIPELADRVIAATALHLNLPLLTVDPSIQESKLIKIIW